MGMEISILMYGLTLYSKEMAAIIRDSLIEKMPENKEDFNQNYQQLANELDELNSEFETTIKC